MKSIAIFLILAFLAGFQAAVIIEEPSPSTPESNPSILEQLQDQVEKLSTQLTGALKGHTDDAWAYLTELLKKHSLHKLPSRKFHYMAKDVQQYGQSLYGQSKEVLKENLKKMGDKVEEMKQHYAVTMVNEEVLDPLYKKVHSFVSWISEQSVNSLLNMANKKLSS